MPRARKFDGTDVASGNGSAEVIESSGDDRDPRITVQMNKDGTIAWSRLRAGTVDALRRAGVQEGGGPEMGAAAIQPALCATLYEALGLLSAAVAKNFGFSNPQVLLWQPSEAGAMAKPTADVLNHHLKLGQYGDVILLLTSAGMIESHKLARLERPASVTTFPRDVPDRPWVPDPTSVE